jgi:hypothetical protein
MPFIDLKQFGEWCEKEAAPFISATVTTTLATGNPYIGLAKGLTTTNGRGGNPLGKVGKDLEPFVTVASGTYGAYYNKLTEVAAKEAAKKLPEYVFC